MITRKTFTLKRTFISLVSGILGVGVGMPSFGNYYNNYNNDYCYNNPYAYNCPCYNYYNQYCPYANSSYSNENYLLDALLIASVVGVGIAIVNSINNNNNYYNNSYPYYSYPYAMPYNQVYTNYRPYQNYYHPNYPYNYYQNKGAVWAPMKNNPALGYPGKQNWQQPWNGAPQGVGATQKGMPWGAPGAGAPNTMQGGAKTVGAAPPSAMPGATKGLGTPPPGGMKAMGATPAMKGGTQAVVPGKSFHQNFKGGTPSKLTPMPYKAPKSFYRGNGHVGAYPPYMHTSTPFRQAMPSQFHAMPTQHMMFAPTRSFAPQPMRMAPMPAMHGMGGMGGFHSGGIHMHGR